MQPRGLNCSGAKEQGVKTKVYFVYRILDFCFFQIMFLFIVLHDVIFNVTTLI
jgi:hypothetical protein